jgi:23S rRNA pseudouridine2605 synthase
MAACGVASRRACEAFIAEGRVTVNGVVAQVGQTVEPDVDKVLLDGKSIAPDNHVYIVLNKPEGTVTTASDTHGRKTVLSCLQGVDARVFPVGRLDMDVEGVLFLTNDGELAHRLMHPSYQVDKVYLAWVYGHMKVEAAQQIEAGVMLEDGMTAPAKAVILNAGQAISLVRLTLHEGRKREVKRLCAAVGHPVKTLHRIAFGNLKVKGMRPGEWRYLSASEVHMLRKLAQLQ